MKAIKLIILLFCIFLLFSLKAEATSSLADEHTLSSERQWAVWHYVNTSVPYLPHYTITYAFSGDSIIDGKNYKKICSSRNEDFSDASLENFFIRETEGKIYMRYDNSQQEWLFFDSTCEAGDTLLLTQGYDTPKYYIYAAIESVQDTIFDNTNGEKRKYWEMSLGFYDPSSKPYFGEYKTKEIFFENIGFSSYGYTPTNYGSTGGGQKLLCMHKGDSLIYISDEGVCYKSNQTGIENTTAEDISFKQQGGECIVTLPGEAVAWSATLSNSNGITVARRSGEGSEIILPATSKGTHILVVKADGKVVKKKVFIK